MSIVTRKRSRSDMESIAESFDIHLPIQTHTRPATPVERDEIYNMQVLNLDFGRTEDDLDHNFLVTALNLGITIPAPPKSTFELTSDNVSAFTVSSNPSDPSSALIRTSESTLATSCSSSQRQLTPTNASSHTTASISSASTTAAPSLISSSKTSSIVKIRKGLRRLSTFTRRKTFDSVIPTVISTASAIEILSDHRPVSAGVPRSAPVHAMQPEHLSRTTTSLPESRRSRVSRPKTIVEEIEDEELRRARERSMKHPHLQRLHVHQLEEQGRFLRFEEEQNRLIQLKKMESRRTIIDRSAAHLQSLEVRHAEIMADLEHRHLTAEIDLTRTLDAERKACDTRLRHMDAYCHGRSSVHGGGSLPRRTVTEDDYRKLVQQYHTRDSMQNLHAARINVLREKQAKQLERIQAKHDAELAASRDDTTAQLQTHDLAFQREELELQQDFWDRRRRMVNRWTLAEAIERSQLEADTGEMFAALPAIAWLDDVRALEGTKELHRRSMPGPVSELKRLSIPSFGGLDFYKATIAYTAGLGGVE